MLLIRTMGSHLASIREPHANLACDLSELDERRKLVDRVLASTYFARAPRLKKFLHYVCDRYLENRLDEISEQQIGIFVFDKTPGYSPGEDNVVRSYARTLRKRLDDYFAAEGSQERLLLRVNRGGYVPEFIERSIEERTATVKAGTSENAVRQDAVQRDSDDATALVHPPSPDRSRKITVTLIGATLLIACAFLSFHAGRRSVEPMSSPAVHRFWSQVIQDKPTIVVPSDTGLTLLLGLTRESVSVPQYVTGQYVSTATQRQLLPEGWSNTNVHRYTDLTDLRLVSQLSQLPELPAARTSIRYARDLRTDDLRHQNAILIGGPNANPWVQLFDQDLNYHLEFLCHQRSFLVQNRKPIIGEESEFPYGPDNWLQVSYGLLSWQRNLSGDGCVLLVEGVSAAGVQGVSEFLFDEQALRVFLPRITDGSGRLCHFEALLRSANVGAAAAKTQVVGLRLH